jgi:hypothetical protein
MITTMQNMSYIKTGTAACQASSDWLELDFFTKSQSFKGQISCPAGIRILDLLNTPSTPGQNAKIEFLELKDCTHENEDGFPKSVCVKKENIVFVSAPDANMGRGLGAKGDFKVYPFVPKSILRVSLQAHHYTITGNLFRTKNQTMLDVLNDNMYFLPLTNVTIAKDGYLCGERPFVAINKVQITECREESICSPCELVEA